MKNKIIILSICVALSASSFLFGVQWEKNEYESESFARSFQEESFRVVVYYDFLKKYDSGKEAQAVNELRGWMEVDLALIEAYKDKLSAADKERALRLIEVVQPYRGQSNIQQGHTSAARILCKIAQNTHHYGMPVNTVLGLI